MMINKMRFQVLINIVESGLVSLLSFGIFIFVKFNFGLDILGYVGIILTITAFVETLHIALFQKPALMGFKTGFKNIKFNKFTILIFIAIPLLFVNSLILSDYFLSSFIYISSYIYVQNIRVSDYVELKYFKILIRSFTISTSSISYLIFLDNSVNEFDLNHVFYFIGLIRVLFVIPNFKVLFKTINPNSENRGVEFLLNSSVSLLRNRLPLIALLPFGLGFLGVYEVFRNIIELYMAPSKAVYLTIQKNLTTSNINQIKFLGVLAGIFTNLIILLSFNFIVGLEIFNIEAFGKINLLPILLLFTLFSYLTDTLSLLLQHKKKIKIDSFNKLITVCIFILFNLIFINFINFEIYLYLVSAMYVLNVFFSLKN